MSATVDSPPTSRQELQRILSARTASMSALAKGASLAARTALVGLPTALAYGLLSGALGSEALDLVQRSAKLDPASIELSAQVATGFGVLATLYAILQFNKRDRVSRASWWPALFAVPLLLTGGGLFFEMSAQAKQYGPVVLSLVLMGWGIFYTTFAGAAASIAWIRSGAEVLDGRPIRPGAILDEVRARLLDVAGPHGAKVHAVVVGEQLALPGIFYALQLAFTECIVVLDPEKPALRRSGLLTFGMRGRLFRLLLVWYLLGTALQYAIMFVVQDALTFDKASEMFFATFIDPTATWSRTYLAQEVVWALLTWVMTLSMLVLYREREGQVRAKTELKKLDATVASDRPSGAS